MRSGPLLLVVSLMVAPIASAAGQSAVSAVDRAGWLAGCWESRNERRTITEMWMLPSAGLMLGASRMVANGAVREFEQLRLRAAGDTLIYTATPVRQQETEFRGIPAEGVLTFENLAHDFPQRIIYRRISADSTIARIEGPGPNGTTRGIDFPMKRVSCS